MTLSDLEYNQATLKGSESAKAPRAVSAYYNAALGRIFIDLSTGFSIAFDPQNTKGLDHAPAAKIKMIEISPSGQGIYFPSLDFDLYLPSLLDGALGSRSYMAARLGKIGGKTQSPRKAQSSRINGKKGGRPRTSSKTGDVA